MFPGSTVKEELHLIFRLLGESSAVSQIPTRGQWLTAGAVTRRSLGSLERARWQSLAAAWAGVGRGCPQPLFGLAVSRGVRARGSSPAAPWDAWASPSLLGKFVPSLLGRTLALACVRLFSLHQISMTGFPLSPSQEPQQKTAGLE